MGGLFKVPSPPSASPAPPAPTPVNTTETDRQRRLDALARQRAGRMGTITTSARGLLVSSDWAPQRKSLLGE